MTGFCFTDVSGATVYFSNAYESGLNASVMVNYDGQASSREFLGYGKARYNYTSSSLAVLGLGIRRKVYGPKSPQVAYQLANLAYMSETRGDTSAAIATYREALSLLASRPPSDPSVINDRRFLAVDLGATGALAEGDSLIRIVIEQAPLDTTKALPYRARSALGFCLTRARRFTEAEPLLLEAEARLGAIPVATLSHDDVVRWLVGRYEAWGNSGKAAVWKERLAKKP